MLTWQQKRGGCDATAGWELTAPSGESERSDSLFQITNFTCHHTADDLLNFALATIKSDCGTATEVFNLRVLPSMQTVLDFDAVAHDVVLRAVGASDEDKYEAVPSHQRSLRAYLEIAYLRPKCSITLCGRAIVPKSVTAGLIQLEHEHFDANHEATKRVHYEFGLDVLPGGSGELSDKRGVCMYWHGRLIRPFELLGMQKNRGGVQLAGGVLGMAEMNHLRPDSSKQAFVLSEERSRAFDVLGKRLKDYVDRLSRRGDDGAGPLLFEDVDDSRLRLTVEAASLAADRMKEIADRAALHEAALLDGRRFLNCDHARCQKLRFFDEKVDEDTYEAFKERHVWYCADNVDETRNSCDAAQEQPREPGASVRCQRFLVQTHADLPVGWQTFKIIRSTIYNGSDHYFIHKSPEGITFTLKKAKEHLEKQRGGAAPAALRAPPNVKTRRAKTSKRRRPAAAEEADDSDEDADDAPAEGADADESSDEEGGTRGAVPEVRRRDTSKAAAPAKKKPKPLLDVRAARNNAAKAKAEAALRSANAALRAQDAVLRAKDAALRAKDAALEAAEHRREGGAGVRRNHPVRATHGRAAAAAASESSDFDHGGVTAAGPGAEEVRSDGTLHGWPREVVYTQRNLVCFPSNDDELELLKLTTHNAPLPGVRITKLKVPHPLAVLAEREGWERRPRGLFATLRFVAGDIIGEYTGHLRFKTYCDADSAYIFDVRDVVDSQDRAVQVDALMCGNETRFINAFRTPGDNGVTIAAEPNVVFEVVHSSPASRAMGSAALAVDSFRVLVRALKEVHPSEELLVNYGDGYAV